MSVAFYLQMHWKKKHLGRNTNCNLTQYADGVYIVSLNYTGTRLFLNSKDLSRQRCQCWVFDVTLACVTVLWAMNKLIDVPLIMSVLSVDAPTSFLWHVSPLCPKYISVTFYLSRRRAWGRIERGQVRELERKMESVREMEGGRKRQRQTGSSHTWEKVSLMWHMWHVIWSFQFPFGSSMPHKRASTDYAWLQRISLAGTGSQPSRNHDSWSCSELHLLWTLNEVWFVDGNGGHNYFTLNRICIFWCLSFDTNTFAYSCTSRLY